MTITWLWLLREGLIRIGFIAASRCAPAAIACTAWERPTSLPPGATTELSAMFCALNGATRTPRRDSQRQMPAVTTDLPASECVPQTSSAPLIAAPVSGDVGRALRAALPASTRGGSDRGWRVRGAVVRAPAH